MRPVPRLHRERKACDSRMMKLASEIRTGLSPLVDLVYPPRCPACGVAVAEHGGLCVDCWSLLEAPAEPADTSDIVAPWVYNDTSRALLLDFKHGGKTSLAKLMARMMATKLESHEAGAGPLLVPVPLHRLRLWERGYNQAALLARELARLGKGELCVDALVRDKRTPSLGGLSRDQRREALKGAIRANQHRLPTLSGREVVLIYDVYTSGATSSACVGALRGAGGSKVTVACFARVIDA